MTLLLGLAGGAHADGDACGSERGREIWSEAECGAPTEPAAATFELRLAGEATEAAGGALAKVEGVARVEALEGGRVRIEVGAGNRVRWSDLEKALGAAARLDGTSPLGGVVFITFAGVREPTGCFESILERLEGLDFGIAGFFSDPVKRELEMKAVVGDATTVDGLRERFAKEEKHRLVDVALAGFKGKLPE